MRYGSAGSWQLHACATTNASRVSARRCTSPPALAPVLVGMTDTSVRARASAVTGGAGRSGCAAATVAAACSAASVGELPKWMTYLPASVKSSLPNPVQTRVPGPRWRIARVEACRGREGYLGAQKANHILPASARSFFPKHATRGVGACGVGGLNRRVPQAWGVLHRACAACQLCTWPPSGQPHEPSL